MKASWNEQALDRACCELALEAGEAAASAVATVFLNALSDVADRAGIEEEQSRGFYLRLSRRVCELLDEGEGKQRPDFF